MTLLVFDYMRVGAKESHVATAVSRLGGKIGSLPAWPLGTEYYITFTRALTDSELKSMDEVNSLRGYVIVKFNGCALNEFERNRIKERLAMCHVLWEYGGTCEQLVAGP